MFGTKQVTRPFTIGDAVEQSLRLHPEQWEAEKKDKNKNLNHLWAMEYVNKTEDWSLIWGHSFMGSGTWISFDKASLTEDESKRVRVALAGMAKLKSEQRRAEALRKHLERAA